MIEWQIGRERVCARQGGTNGSMDSCSIKSWRGCRTMGGWIETWMSLLISMAAYACLRCHCGGIHDSERWIEMSSEIRHVLGNIFFG